MTFDRFSAGKTADGLIHHSLEDGGRKILLGGSLVDQWLNVSLCKYTAACGNRIDGVITLGILIEAGSVCLQKARHLIDERAGSAGADAVHPLLDAVGKVDDLGVLAAKFDGYVCLWLVVL